MQERKGWLSMTPKLSMFLTSLCVSPAMLLGAMPRCGEIAPCKKANMKETICDEQSPRTQRVEAKHIEANGVGYNEGYSTLEGFFTIPSTLDGSWVPFLDIRGHISNNGKPAVNGGVGIRYLTDSRVWGLNTYYDYRKTNRFHYNQVGFGFETLGEIWDFRVNAYVPVGKKDSHLFNTHFHEFKHHSITLSSKKEVAMKGANAEVGAHALRMKNWKLYAATGPYYFEREAKVAWGGEARVALTIYDHVRLQLSGSYDSIFRGIVQGEVAFTFSFGGKRTIKQCKDSSNYCSKRAMIEERALQRVDRNEMIVVTKKHQKTKAVNPETGDPYTVWFVDNTSHSQGTFESPFNTLADAQNASGKNDIIYVFTGDGTSNGMNAGITLKNGQQLLGAGIAQQVETARGLINIPAHDTGLPMISNDFATPSNVCVLLNEGNNIVSGFFLVDNIGGGNLPGSSDFSAGVRIDDKLNYLIKNNTFSTFTTSLPVLNPGGSGVAVRGGGNVTVMNNILIGRDTGPTIGLEAVAFSPLEGYFIIKNNLFTGANSGSGLAAGIGFFPLQTSELDNTRVSILNNTFNSQTNAGDLSAIFMEAAPKPSQSMKLDIIGNNVVMPATLTGVFGGIVIRGDGAGPVIATLHKNTVLTSTTTIPGYRFINHGNPALLQLNMGSDNFGISTGP